jgi:tellurite resistance protein
VVGADRQHIAHPALADAPAQLTAAVHLVSGHEGGADPQGLRVVQQVAGQLGLGSERHLLRDPG